MQHDTGYPDNLSNIRVWILGPTGSFILNLTSDQLLQQFLKFRYAIKQVSQKISLFYGFIKQMELRWTVYSMDN